jgi:hypothetical protein
MAKIGQKSRMCRVFFSFSEKNKFAFLRNFLKLKKKNTEGPGPLFQRLYIFVGFEKRK